MLVPNSINTHLNGLGHSATLAINEKSKALQQAGKTIHRFGLGQSPFPVPNVVIEALKYEAHQKDYLPVKGLQPLREAVSTFHAKHDELSIAPEHILIGPGSKEMMFILQMVFDSELLLPSPSWVSYLPQANILGKEVSLLETRFEDDWCLQPEVLEAHCQQSPNKARLLILNYPNNPSGCVFDEATLSGLAEVARRYGVLILSDEIYAELVFDGQHRSIAQFYPEGTIVSAGLSKWCGAGGWRLGTFAFPKELDWLLNAMTIVASETYSAVSAPISYAAIKAFEFGPEVERYVHHSRRIMKAVCDYGYHALSTAGAKLKPTKGGFYMFPDFSGQREKLARKNITDGAALSSALLEEAGVALLPGSCFLRPKEELTLRLALVDFDAAMALEASANFNGDLGDDFVKTYAPSVYKGINNMVGWLDY